MRILRPLIEIAKALIFCVMLTELRCQASGSEMEKRPSAAMAFVQSTRADFGVRVDPAKWRRDSNTRDLFMIQLIYTEGEMLGVFDSERMSIPLELYQEKILESLRSRFTDVRIVARETRKLSSKEVLFLKLEGTLGLLRITAYAEFYTGREGTVRLVVTFPTESEDKYKKEAETLLAGLHIGEVDANEAKAVAHLEFASQPKPTPASETSARMRPVPDAPVVAPVHVAQDPSVATQLEAQAKKGDARAQYLLAIFNDEGKGMEKDPAQAVELMTRAAETLPEAQAALGSWYAVGHNVSLDYEKAQQYLRPAAEKGAPNAQVNLGRVVFASDPASAVRWFRKAADQDFADGEYDLARAYLAGGGVERDAKEAVKYLQKAARHGKCDAMEMLGERYYSGEGISRDQKEAVRCFREAARGGAAVALLNLGICCWRGDGVVMDKVEAAKFFRQAAEKGNGIAQDHLAKCYLNGQGIEKDERQAIAWFEKAASQGIAHSEAVLGAIYSQGRGVAKDQAKGREWTRKGAEHGEVLAQTTLGLVYWNGEGVSRDTAEAVKWFQKAAANGNSISSYMLARAYFEGEGIEKDQAAGFDWIKKSAEANYAPAQFYYAMRLGQGATDTKTMDAALEWLRKSADQGFAVAEFRYGLELVTGKRLTRDSKEGVQWFRYSALQGCPQGENAFGYSLATGDGIEADLVEAYKWYILAMGQTTDPQPKRDAEVNMQRLLPQLTPEQVEEGKKRAKKFIPILQKQQEEDDFLPSISIG